MLYRYYELPIILTLYSKVLTYKLCTMYYWHWHTVASYVLAWHSDRLDCYCTAVAVDYIMYIMIH